MIVVIGGGATGLGVAWDLVLRKIPVTVIEKGICGLGTSGRFHGLLHSGGRYAVTDPNAAKECIEENSILQKIAHSAIEATGGYFVRKRDDDPHFENDWLEDCAHIGIPVEVLKGTSIREKFPFLSPEIVSAYHVPDGVLEGFVLIKMLADAIVARGGSILEHSQVTKVHANAGAVNGVTVTGNGETTFIGCDAVVDATGPWVSETARLFGVEIDMIPTYGTMVIFANRRLDSVINRLKEPGDGDIFVPHKSVVILGTTSVVQESPEAPIPQRSEVQRLMTLGQELIPDLEQWRVLRAFNGVRPLYAGKHKPEKSKHVTRDFTVIDHTSLGGPRGTFSVVGGKWTTFRRMGERTADVVCDYLNEDAPSISKTTLIDTHKTPAKAHDAPEALLCECEGVKRSDLVGVDGSIDKWRTETWFSMGPCQGTFCIHRVLGLRRELYPDENFDLELAKLRAERTKGFFPVGWGANVREFALQRSVRLQTLSEEVDE